MTIKITINDYEERKALVFALANNGYPVTVEEKRSQIGRLDGHYVVFEVGDEEETT